MVAPHGSRILVSQVLDPYFQQRVGWVAESRYLRSQGPARSSAEGVDNGKEGRIG